MQPTYTEITLKNAGDVIAAERGTGKESEIRQITVRAMADTGRFTMIITEALQQGLGLTIRGKKDVTLANGTIETCHIADPIEIHWKNRFTIMPALVLEDSNDILLGALPLDDMDLVIDPARGGVAGAHDIEILGTVK